MENCASSITWDACLNEINNLIDCFDWENAHSKCVEASKIFPNTPEVYITHGSVLLELQRFEEAREAFAKAFSLDPKCVQAIMNLGQLEENSSKALSFFQQAVEVLSQKTATSATAEAHFECSLQLSSVLCSVAELFLMPDLCDLPDAESQCEDALNNALATCPSNLEVLVTLASFRLCQQRPDEACEALKDFHDRVAKLGGIAASNHQSDDASIGENGESFSQAKTSNSRRQKIEDEASFEAKNADLLWPSFECRLNAVRLMIETGKLFDEALNVLLRLEAEDDEVIDVHYLFAFIYFQMKDVESARESIADAEMLIEKLKLEDPEMMLALGDLKQQITNSSS